MRRLPHLDVERAKIALSIYNDKMRLNLTHENFRDNLIQIYRLTFGLNERQALEILEALPGLSKGIDDFTDEEDVNILEPLEGPLRNLTERRMWRWVKPDWDYNNLNLWDKLSHPDIINGEYAWKTPVPGPSLEDLLYNSKRILDGLPNPSKWEDYGNETGLVLGSVQSGKTASMLGVSSLALDQRIGYKILIVLGGHTENLRSQTLGRFEVFQSILKSNVHFPVKKDADLRDLQRKNRREELAKHVKAAKNHLDDEKPVIFVVKKNEHSLKGLIAIMNEIHKNGNKYPTLILDDESDHSSLNTKQNKELGSTIHRLISELRKSISRNTYLGYTATPQGVLLSNPDSPLFPNDLLWLLEPHNKYVGPNDFFNGMSSMLISRIEPDEFPNYGDKKVEDTLSEEDSPKLKDWQLEVIKSWKENGAPPSIYSAIIDFILTGAIRWWREDFTEKTNFPDHALMIHANRLNYAQKIIGNVIEKTWIECSNAVIDLINREFNIDNRNKYDQIIQNRWKRIDANIQIIRYDPKDRPTLDCLSNYMKMIIETVSKENNEFIRDGIRIVNSKEGSELPYHLEDGKGRPPKALILIGGDLLSRGVTIEGLCVSYYLRLAKKPSVDTELQRCRWFGAKKDYEDLLTLHIQPAHQRMFKDLTDHNNDLISQVRETVIRGYNPRESILMLATRDSYQVTGYSKRGKLTTKLEDSYSGNNVQFKDSSIKKSEENLVLLNEYLSSLRIPDNIIGGKRGKLWTNVNAEKLINFIEKIHYDHDAPSMIRPDELARYLRKWKEENGVLPEINVVQRFGDGENEVSERGRETDGSNGRKFVRTSYKNLASSAGGKYSGDWFIDAMEFGENAKQMDKEKYQRWFQERPFSTQSDWFRKRSRKRTSDAPILFVFYKLDEKYVHRKREDGGKGKWYLDPEIDTELISKTPRIGFLSSLPKGGPMGGGIVNSLLLDEKMNKMIGGREI